MSCVLYQSPVLVPDSGTEPLPRRGWGVIAVGFIILVLFILIVYFLIRQQNFGPTSVLSTPLTTITINSNPNSNFGASLNGVVAQVPLPFPDPASCEASPNRSWVNGTCTCLSPFYGPTCNLEAFSGDYTAVGMVSTDQLILPETRTIETSTLSFPSQPRETACTDACNADPTCTGVIWNPTGTTGECTLLLGDIGVVPGFTPTFNPQQPSNLFVKDSSSLVFTDRVFLISGTPPLRPWQQSIFNSTSGNSASVSTQTLRRINFLPTMQLNATGSRGILSTSAFNPGEIYLFAINPEPNMIVLPATDSVIAVPPEWRPPLFVAYE